MSRRLIDSCISQSVKWNSLKSDSERMLYFLMLAHADRYGRGNCDPAGIKMLMLPGLNFTNVQTDEMIQSLHNVGLLTRYSVDGKCYYQIYNWDKYQSFNEKNRKQPSRFPEVPNGLTQYKTGQNSSEQSKTVLNCEYVVRCKGIGVICKGVNECECLKKYFCPEPDTPPEPDSKPAKEILKPETLSANLFNYWIAEFQRVFHERPVQPTANQKKAFNVQVKKYSDTGDIDYRRGTELIRWCMSRKDPVTALSAIFSTSWINSFIAETNKQDDNDEVYYGPSVR